MGVAENVYGLRWLRGLLYQTLGKAPHSRTQVYHTNYGQWRSTVICDNTCKNHTHLCKMNGVRLTNAYVTRPLCDIESSHFEYRLIEDGPVGHVNGLG